MSAHKRARPEHAIDRKRVAQMPAASRPETDPDLVNLLTRIADALDRLAPSTQAPQDLAAADAFVWTPSKALDPIKNVSRVDLSLLKGIDHVRDILLNNTHRFANGFPANNALLWGARGMGKSSLVNRLLGEERLLATEIAGTTRDPIDAAFERDGLKPMMPKSDLEKTVRAPINPSFSTMR